MAVFRIERTKDYTVMSNHHLRNHELSLKAKGLLSMMLSLAGMFLAMTVPCIHRWKTYRAVFRFLIEIAGW